MPGPTLRQERLAEALLDPNIKTKTAALLAAGYAPSTAATSPGLIMRLAGVQRAKRELEEARLDSARKIARKAGQSVLDRLETMQDAPLIMAWKTAEELKQGEPEEETRFLPPSYLRERRKRKALRHWINGAKAALVATQPGISAEERQRLITALMTTKESAASPPIPIAGGDIIDGEVVQDGAPDADAARTEDGA